MNGYKLSAALLRFRLVTTNTDGELAYCGSGGIAIGSLQQGAPDDTFAIDTVVTPDCIAPGKEATLDSGEALAIGDMFKAGADGVASKDATKTVDTLGKVLTVASGASVRTRVVFGV